MRFIEGRLGAGASSFPHTNEPSSLVDALVESSTAAIVGSLTPKESTPRLELVCTMCTSSSPVFKGSLGVIPKAKLLLPLLLKFQGSLPSRGIDSSGCSCGLTFLLVL